MSLAYDSDNMTETVNATAIALRPKFPPELAGKLWRWLNSPREPNFDD